MSKLRRHSSSSSSSNVQNFIDVPSLLPRQREQFLGDNREQNIAIFTLIFWQNAAIHD